MSDETQTDQTVAPVQEAAPAPVPPRELSTIQLELEQANQRHATAVAALEQEGGVIAGLTREYRSAVTWFSKECDTIEAKFADILSKL